MQQCREADLPALLSRHFPCNNRDQSMTHSSCPRRSMVANVDGGGALHAAACSNDACGALPSLTAPLKAGVGYAFIVDGVNGASGKYIFRWGAWGALLRC